MFEITLDELENWRSQFATSNSEKMGFQYLPPFCFTEQGVAMLSQLLTVKRYKGEYSDHKNIYKNAGNDHGA